MSGALICTGNITAYSDIRLKHNITTISEPNEKLKKINGYEFDWKEKNNKKHDIGVIAQEIEKVIPEVVIESDGEIILFIDELHAALRELSRVSRSNAYLTVEAYRNEREKINLLY